MKSSRGFEMPLYFEMPKQFLGDRLLSYGGLLKFSIEMMECKTELDQITVQHFPLIRIHAHNSLILDYFGVCGNIYIDKLNGFQLKMNYIIWFENAHFVFFSQKHLIPIQISLKRFEWLKHIGDCMQVVKLLQGEFLWRLYKILLRFLFEEHLRLLLQALREWFFFCFSFFK